MSLRSSQPQQTQPWAALIPMADQGWWHRADSMWRSRTSHVWGQGAFNLESGRGTLRPGADVTPAAGSCGQDKPRWRILTPTSLCEHEQQMQVTVASSRACLCVHPLTAPAFHTTAAPAHQHLRQQRAFPSTLHCSQQKLQRQQDPAGKLRE